MKIIWNWIVNLFKKGKEHKPVNQGKPVFIPEDVNFGKVRIHLHGLEGFTSGEKKRFKMALKYGHTVLNSKEFRERMQKSFFRESNGLSGEQVWELICKGKDLYNPESDHDIDVFVTMYENFWTGTVGYTYPNTLKSWINRKFFRKFSEPEIFGNVMHEAMHNFGFDHVDLKHKHETVPYKVGYITRDLLKEIKNGNGLTPLNTG